jgi:Ethanolamine utilization protein EutJ (predicted chaperonin)
MISRSEHLKRPTSHLNSVLQSLKLAATRELKLKKAEEDKKNTEVKEKTVKELKEIKEKLEHKVKQKNFNDNWSKDYFDQHKEVL